MQECADKLIETFVHMPFMVDTGRPFQEDPDASARAAQVGSNAVRGYMWVVTAGPNTHYRPGPNQHGLPSNPVRGAKPPWHDLTLQMAVTHAGITKATTNMKEAAPLNTMPDASTFGTKGNNHRTRWWVYTVAAMAACDALGKVRRGSCVACALYHLYCALEWHHTSMHTVCIDKPCPLAVHVAGQFVNMSCDCVW